VFSLRKQLVILRGNISYNAVRVLHIFMQNYMHRRYETYYVIYVHIILHIYLCYFPTYIFVEFINGIKKKTHRFCRQVDNQRLT